MTAAPPTLDDLHGRDTFVDVTFSDLADDAADLTDKRFERCRFAGCVLPASVWHRTQLEDCVFDHCDLSRIATRGMSLRGVTFQQTKLMGVDWSGLARLPDVVFEGCDLRYASFVKLHLRGTRFIGCLAREANFLETDLTKADFTETDLLGATISGCTLTETDFARATGLLFDPKRNKTKGTRVSLDCAIALAEAAGLLLDGVS